MQITTTLDRMFVCETCSTILLSEREDYKGIAGHSGFMIHDLPVGRDRTE